MGKNLTDELKESVRVSAPGPLLIEEDGVICFCWHVPRSMDLLHDQIRRLSKEREELIRERNFYKFEYETAQRQLQRNDLTNRR